MFHPLMILFSNFILSCTSRNFAGTKIPSKTSFFFCALITMAAPAPMEHSFRELLVAEQVHPDLIDYLEAKSITTAARLANYCDSRKEVRDLLVDACQATQNDRTQATIVIGLWRDAENETQERSKRKAVGYTETDMEVALDPSLEVNLVRRFHTAYKYSLSEHELLWGHLLGRLRREIDRGNHTLIHVKRVGSQRESGRSEAAKKLRLGDAAVVTLAARQSFTREIPHTFVYLILLTILLEGGYAVVGNFVDAKTARPWVSLEECKEYLLFVRLRACPLIGNLPDLDKVVKADEDTRSLWAASMRSGLTMSEAMFAHKAEMNALWLWACSSRVAATRQDIAADDGSGDGPATPPRVPPPPRPPRGGKSVKAPRGRGQGEDKPAKRPKVDLQPAKGDHQGKKKYATTAKSGKQFCIAWNRGQCVEGHACPNERVHACNLILENGKTCGGGHRCNEGH